MANEIHNYPLEVYSIGPNDYYDVDTFNGVGYDTAKIKGSNLKSGMYAMIDDSSLVTGTSEQNFMDGTAIGSLSVPANGFKVGDSFRLSVCGQLGAHNNDTLTIRLKSGSAILSTSTPITMPAITLEVFELVAIFVIRDIGSSGVAKIMVNTGFTWNKSSANIYEGQNWLYLNDTTFDTTIPNTLSLTAQWSTSNTQNKIQSIVANLERLF
jgi:hypothetical protein